MVWTCSELVILVTTSQVAAQLTTPGGNVVGIDIIPTQPLDGVITIRGDFLSESLRQKVREVLQQQNPARNHRGTSPNGTAPSKWDESQTNQMREAKFKSISRDRTLQQNQNLNLEIRDHGNVDVVLSDMSAH